MAEATIVVASPSQREPTYEHDTYIFFCNAS